MNKLNSAGIKWVICTMVLALLFSGLPISAEKNNTGKDNNKKMDRNNLCITYDYMNLDNPVSGSIEEKKVYDFVINYRGNVTFVVKNVNPFLYKVKINSSVIDYYQKAPKFFQDTADQAMEFKKSTEGSKNTIEQLKKEITKQQNSKINEIKILIKNSKESKDIQLKQKIKDVNNKELEIKNKTDSVQKKENDWENAETNLKTVQTQKNEAEEKKDEAEKKVTEIKSTIENLQPANQDITINKTKLEAAEKELKEAENTLSNLTKAEEEVQKKVDEAKKALDEAEIEKDTALKDFEESNNHLNEVLTAENIELGNYNNVLVFLERLKNVDTILNFYSQLVNCIFKIDSFSKIDENVRNFCNVKKLDCSYETEQISKFYQWIYEVSETYDKIDFNLLVTGKDPTKGLVPSQIEVIKSFQAAVDNILKLDIIGKIQIIFNNLTEKNFERSVTVPNVESDEIQFEVEIEPLPSTEGIEVIQKLAKPVKVFVQHGWIINFSTGLAFNINAHDRTYKIENAPTSTTENPLYIIKENENKKSINPSVVALMHIYPRSVKGTKWGGLTFGIGTTDTKKFNYHFGTSFMLGTPRRLVLNGGIVISEMNYLKPGYKTNVACSLPSTVTAETLIGKEYKARIFFGITYNLNK